MVVMVGKNGEGRPVPKSVRRWARKQKEMMTGGLLFFFYATFFRARRTREDVAWHTRRRW